MSDYKLPISVEEAVAESVENLCSDVQRRKIDADGKMKTSVESNGVEDIHRRILQAASPRLTGFLEALVNGF